jgi:hypothetical protein
MLTDNSAKKGGNVYEQMAASVLHLKDLIRAKNFLRSFPVFKITENTTL